MSSPAINIEVESMSLQEKLAALEASNDVDDELIQLRS